ncbi:hypothetical protein NMY22_g18891 [Coprinellus aureogranulatus]|nr:hypothetical protein NMY22_g18891 [Coprinellus aureogranulatus]
MRPGFMGPPPAGAVSFLPPLPPAPPLPPQLLSLAGSSPPSASTSPVVSPPVPAPMTAVPFALDSTRYYLLGQLEYYLSPQNMAKDFFLKKKMDSRGWIPISLIASFNRVKKLTQDVNLVKEVLYLSSMSSKFDVGVNLNHPMYPTLNGMSVAPPQPGLFGFGAPMVDRRSAAQASGVTSGGESTGGEEDEEDVVFVLERESV